ncbi:PepSY domain-containing protein [Streptomyces sp. NPDC016626]|uniref:PepSY domain-containing protein n=1 Tax=Streptomyces sp. NPDC016626 TaxID=3364968 RepID=UPI0036F83DFA
MKRNIVIAVVTAAALVGGGTATALAVSGDDDGAASVTRTETRAGDDDGRDDEQGREDADGRDDRDDRDDDRGDDRGVSGGVTAADAIAAALKHTPGTAVSAELDDDDDDDNGGRAAWEVDVLGGGDTWYSVRVDPATGKVLGAQKDDADDTDEVRGVLKGTSVTAEEAARAAAAKGTVVSVGLDDDERGWEAETAASGGGEKDWRVGPGSGKVTADRGDDSDGSDDSDDSDD